MKKLMSYTLIALAVVGVAVFSVGFSQALRVTSQGSSPAAIQASAATATVAAKASAGTTPGTSSAPSTSSTPASPQSSKKANTLNLLILGDSIAKGTGDEKGKGFTQDLPDALKNSTSKDIQVNNAGIDGLESPGLLSEIQSKKLDSSIADSDLILISIGGNDLRSILTLNSLAQEDAFKGKLDNYINTLKASLQQIRAVNPKATIIFLGLYNPFEKATSPEDQSFLEEWNYKSQQLIESDSKAIFIPTYDLMKYNLNRYLAIDGMHPNAMGYQALSNRMSQAIGAIL